MVEEHAESGDGLPLPEKVTRLRGAGAGGSARRGWGSASFADAVTGVATSDHQLAPQRGRHRAGRMLVDRRLDEPPTTRGPVRTSAHTHQRARGDHPHLRAPWRSGHNERLVDREGARGGVMTGSVSERSVIESPADHATHHFDVHSPAGLLELIEGIARWVLDEGQVFAVFSHPPHRFVQLLCDDDGTLHLATASPPRSSLEPCWTCITSSSPPGSRSSSATR